MHQTTGSRLPDAFRTVLRLLLIFPLVCVSVFADETEGETKAIDTERSPEVLHADPDAAELPIGVEPESEPLEATVAEPVEVKSFTLLGGTVAPGSLRRLAWYASDNPDGLSEATPVLVAHGTEPGPALCLSAAVHGDELNGIEIVRDLLYDLEPERLRGTVIGVPIVNLYGFRQGSRYLSDRRDLNRYFPGNPNGSSASRIAHSFFQSIVRHCDYLVDLHTGSFHRTNLPQLRADLDNKEVVHLTKGFGATVVLHGNGPDGSLRRAATDAGIPSVVVEAGEPMRARPEEVAHGIRALRSLLNHLDMVPKFSLWGEPQPIYYDSNWVRVESHGILTSKVDLGQSISEGDVLGRVTNPITNERNEIHSPYSGRVLGMALNRAMRPGYAAYHIGIRKPEEDLAEEVDVETLKQNGTTAENQASDPDSEAGE